MIKDYKLKKKEEHKCFFVQAVFRFLSYNCVGGGGGRIFYAENDFSYCVVISFIVLPFLSKKKKTEGYLKRECGRSIADYCNTKSGFSLRLKLCVFLLCTALSALFGCITHTYNSPLGYRGRP